MREQILHDERGFTLVEMLVTMVMMLVVMSAIYSIFDMGLRVFSYGNNKVEATENARVGLEKMAREIRAAYPVDKANLSGGCSPYPNGKCDYLFFNANGVATTDPSQAMPTSTQITFGNDNQINDN